jgi:hypothetical protein
VDSCASALPKAQHSCTCEYDHRKCALVARAMHPDVGVVCPRLRNGERSQPTGLGCLRLPLRDAQAALEDLVGHADPEWYALAVSVGLDAGKTPEDLHEIADQGRKYYPTYYPIYNQMMRVLMPRWQGSYDDENRFVNQMSNRWSSSPDLILYARLYWMYSSLEYDQISIFEDGAADWHLVMPGSLTGQLPHLPAR